MYEAPAIIGTCIDCIAPGSLGATLALTAIGAAIALSAERRKMASARTATSSINKKTAPNARAG
jgi:hypothetical protein